MKLISFFFLFAFGLIILSCSDNKTIPFDKNKWMSGDWRQRGRMVDEIISDSIFIGKPKDEVLDILGEPTAGATNSRIGYVVDIGKEVGPFGLGGVWLFYLYVDFDTLQNKVIDVSCRD